MPEPLLEEVISPSQVAAAVEKLAGLINRDYKDKELVFVGVLKGSFIFMADLVRHLEIPVKIEFVRASSYGSGMSSKGAVELGDMDLEIQGRDVIVVEDIIDTGQTLAAIIARMKTKGPSSLRVCTLLDKPSRRMTGYRPDYIGIEVEDVFLVGYGLDHAENHRHLKGLYKITLQS